MVYWQNAGQRAIERSANVEAVEHLIKGLEILKTLPETPERAQQELTLHLALGTPLLMIKGHTASEVEQTYARARELCQQVGETQQLLPALYGLWLFYLNQAQFQTARELGEQCFTLARRTQDPALQQDAHHMLGTTLFHLGELVSAHAHLEQAIALYDPRQGRFRAFSRGADPTVSCLSRSAWTLWMLGYPEQALVRSHEALTLARELSHAYSLAFALHYTAMIRLFRREARLAQEWAEATIALSREQGFVYWLGGGMFMQGWALTEQGSTEEGIVQLLQAQDIWRAAGTELAQVHIFVRLAEAYRTLGKTKEGLQMLTEALAVVQKNMQHCYEAELYRLKGELLIQKTAESGETRTAALETSMMAEAERRRGLHASPLHTEAEACFRQALDVARHQQAKSLELRAAMSLSRLWQQQGKRAEARQMLAGIYSWFTEGFDTPDLQEATALLEL
jgi:predicted ATPase